MTNLEFDSLAAFVLLATALIGEALLFKQLLGVVLVASPFLPEPWSHMLSPTSSSLSCNSALVCSSIQLEESSACQICKACLHMPAMPLMFDNQCQNVRW